MSDDRNIFEPDPEWEREFLRTYPRWRFHNCWKPYHGMSGFSLVNVWWWKDGTMGINLLNFAVEFNPYHKEAA